MHSNWNLLSPAGAGDGAGPQEACLVWPVNAQRLLCQLSLNPGWVERAARPVGQPWRSGRTQVIVGRVLPGSLRKGRCQETPGRSHPPGTQPTLSRRRQAQATPSNLVSQHTARINRTFALARCKVCSALAEVPPGLQITTCPDVWPAPWQHGCSAPARDHHTHLCAGCLGANLSLHAILHFTTAQMVITDLTAPAERPAALGRLGLCFGIGVIFGSLLGGTLNTTYGIQCPAIVALVVTLLGAVLSFTCVPVTTKEAGVQSAHQGGTKASVFDLKAITRLLLLPNVLPVFLVKVISGFPSGVFMVMFSIISMDFFQLEAAQPGYLISFFGVLQMVIQGLVIGRLSTHFPEEALLRSSVLVFAVVGLGMALMSNVLHFCFLMPGLVFSFCALNVVTDSMLTKAVSASDTGTMLGLSASVHPLTRTVGPTLGGLLYRSYGVAIFGQVQLMVNLLVLLVLWRKPLSQKKDKAQ
ncbi:solute carrier family 22 member 18 isoform X1 [Cricetulus griseus]|uniref:solute carrier family 22 member 18 isoform X1 n=1 Tax=Cricetulus griseus TaxID=10029 RepID=UPI0015C2EDE0|nr:solute carrier family 22 member 18 isoform X1 [Cricetulus griseus]